MALVCVEAELGDLLPRAEDLARRLGVPACVNAEPRPTGLKLIVAPAALALGFLDPKRGKPFVVDFETAAWRSRFMQPLARGHIFRRALGVKEEPLTMVDATAGFGQDALLAVSIGVRVTAVERAGPVALLLEDAIERARRGEERLRERLTQVRIQHADAVDYLGHLAANDRPNIVYIDPMFDKPKHSAKSPKQMQLLQELLGPEEAGGEARLLEAALEATKARVVVKRPLKARAGKPPSHSFKGQSIRYDVYLKS